MSDVPDHFCPACGTPLKALLRYPWHLCIDCRNTAVDGAGRALEFGNVDFSGGFMFRYAGADENPDDDGWITCRAVIALVSGRPVRITEARLGGVVAEPIPDRLMPEEDGVFDLRRSKKVEKPTPRPEGRGRRDPFSPS